MRTLHAHDATSIPKKMITVAPEVRLLEALQLMQTHDIHHLVVCPDQNDVQGVISDRDIFSRGVIAGDQFTFSSTTVAEVMHPITHPIIESMTLQQILTNFREWHVSALPVVRGGKLVGIITENDLLRVFGRLMAHDEEDPPAWGQIILAHPLCQSAMRMLDTVGI